eukprot:scaffold1328_cov394-Prasinococcus_capsulatus_cf.AAC.46
MPATAAATGRREGCVGAGSNKFKHHLGNGSGAWRKAPTALFLAFAPGPRVGSCPVLPQLFGQLFSLNQFVDWFKPVRAIANPTPHATLAARAPPTVAHSEDSPRAPDEEQLQHAGFGYRRAASSPKCHDPRVPRASGQLRAGSRSAHRVRRAVLAGSPSRRLNAASERVLPRPPFHRDAALGLLARPKGGPAVQRSEAHARGVHGRRP